ncbi:hypothetical protein C2S53_009832 [Perilla frutescens var. hirtella]|uniref:Uncharacterized protein n=1 Tax=Perilla frutescens var. hirtella TaxID=608512 RepID=A0AAD4JIQ0_PERFH|nr:hypothetical protein C2S53_009832 [Perilla frutescens var. hirtella]
MIAAEEFTFPVISSGTAVNLSLLPPLWRISDGADSDKASTAGRQRRTFATQIFKLDERGTEAEEGSQEKMDLLWEDFNEELMRSSSAASSDSDYSREIVPRRDSGGEFETLEECANVRQLKLIPAKPRKLGSLVKVVKNLFNKRASN